MSLQPPLNAEDASNVLAVNGGLIVNGTIHENSCLVRGRNLERVYGDPKKSSPEDQIGHATVFGGYLINHYGHFLLEGLSRIWALKQRPDLAAVWLVGKGKRLGYSQMQAEILDILGVRNKPILVCRPTVFRQMLIPDPGYINPFWFHPDHVRALEVRQGLRPVSGKRVWLSRSNLPNRGGFENELEAERHLETNGWTIFHPENFKVNDQLQMFADAEEIAGIEGSAFHTLVFFNNLKAKISIFTRPRGKLTPNFATISLAKSWQQRIFSLPFDFIDAGDTIRPALQRAVWRDPQAVVKKLKQFS